MFWIATAFLAAGLFLAPVVGGREPRFQRLGVNVLFGALLVVVAGSLAGEALAIHQKLGLGSSFWFGTRATSTWTSAASGRSRSSRGS